MSRFIRLMLVLLALATAPAVPSLLAATASPVVHHSHHGQLGDHGPGPADHGPDHVCIGCAVPARDAAPPGPVPALGLRPALPLLQPLGGRATSLDPPPPRHAA
jgi:hypothetical protein